MRILIMYDLPINNKSEVKIYANFRNSLLNKGFIMMQESVYIKQCINHESVNRTMIHLNKILPPKGDIRVLQITEKQYDDMKLLRGNKSLNEKLTEKGTLILI